MDFRSLPYLNFFGFIGKFDLGFWRLLGLMRFAGFKGFKGGAGGAGSARGIREGFGRVWWVWSLVCGFEERDGICRWQKRLEDESGQSEQDGDRKSLAGFKLQPICLGSEKSPEDF